MDVKGTGLGLNTGVHVDRQATNLNPILRPSPYRTVNTHRLGYKNQSVNAV